MATLLVTSNDFIQSLQKSLPASSSNFFAFFSSVTGGIVTDPALMVVPMDDHMVHRGHAVFDTANIWDGKAYGINFHLDRLFKSSKQARIPVPYTKEEMKKIILHTAAASQQRDGVMIRYWLSVGRGGFGITPTECKGQSNFFVMIHKWTPKLETGVKEYTVSVPLKPPFLATMKTTNYLLNALAAMQSEEKGGYIGIWVDEKGMIAEASVSCLGFLGQDGVLRTPNFDEILAGTTVIRALELYGKDHPVKQCPVSAADARKSKEIIIFGGGGSVAVTHWDNVPIGDGKPGPIYRKINGFLLNDLKQSEHLDDIPYHLYPARIVSKL